MTVSPGLMPTLSAIAAATGSHGFLYANPKNPMVKTLEKEGYVESDAGNKNPNDAAQVAYRTTAKGAAEIAPPADGAEATEPFAGTEPGTADQAPPVVDASQPMPDAPEAAAPAAPSLPDEPRKRGRPAGEKRGPTGPRVAPTVHAAAGPMALPTGAVANRAELLPFATLAAPVPATDTTSAGYHSFFIAATERYPDPARTYSTHMSKKNKLDGKPGKFKIFPVEAGSDHAGPNGEAGARVYRMLD